VTGDTAFARGVPSPAPGGSRGELLDSLARLGALRARARLPGHGASSDDPAGDLQAGAARIRRELACLGATAVRGSETARLRPTDALAILGRSMLLFG
jgi:glyoxylase-like metal-dependent hydrolase (beta-lactamase superfamily II)